MEISVIRITRDKLKALVDVAHAMETDVPNEVYLMLANYIKNDESFMFAVKDIMDGSYLFHGSIHKGHLQIPAEMKGAILYGKAMAYFTDALTTKMQDLSKNVKFTYKTLRANQAWFHPVFVAALLEEFGAPFDKVIEWKEKNLTSECAASPRPTPIATPAESTWPLVAQAA